MPDANRNSYLNMLPTSIRMPLKRMFNSNAVINNPIDVDVASTAGIKVSAATTDAITLDSTFTHGLDFNHVNTTSAIALHFIAAYTGKVIETGTYSSTASNAVTLSSTNTRPVSFLADDAGAVMTGNIRGVLSRVLLTALHTGSLTVDAIRGQIKFPAGVDFDADYASGVQGYIEISGSTDFNLNSDDHAVCGIRSRVEVGANLAIQQGYLAGVYVELNTTGAYSVTQDADGILAGMVITYTDQKNDAWGYGIYMAPSSVDVGMVVNNAVTGISLAGTTTTGIAILGASTNAISITGASSVAQINLSHTLAAADDRCILITSSSSSTSAGTSQAPIKMTHTMTGVGAVGGRAEFNTTYNASGAIGGWSNALKGNFTFGANCTGGTGLHSAVCAEITVPNVSVSGGFYTGLEVELNLPASHVPQAKQLSMMYFSPNTTAATFDTYGTLFELAGVSVGAGKVFDTCTAGAASHALRITIAGTYYYIMLQDNVDA